VAILLDTGILYALADEDDSWHQRARGWLEGVSELLLIPVAVLPEITYLLHTRLGPQAERRFVSSIATGEIELDMLKPRDVGRAHELMARYPDLGFVDLSIVATAERLKIRTIATTDRRHFGRVTPKHVPVFECVPEASRLGVDKWRHPSKQSPGGF
jgi:predicted nucleic acid-binding protein